MAFILMLFVAQIVKGQFYEKIVNDVGFCAKSDCTCVSSCFDDCHVNSFYSEPYTPAECETQCNDAGDACIAYSIGTSGDYDKTCLLHGGTALQNPGGWSALPKNAYEIYTDGKMYVAAAGVSCYLQLPDPTRSPTVVPTTTPTVTPTVSPTVTPTNVPSSMPTNMPTVVPTLVPSRGPTQVPTVIPTATPTVTPTFVPTFIPTTNPTQMPTRVPTVIPTATPTVTPTSVPTFTPTTNPTRMPTRVPTVIPTTGPTFTPTFVPTFIPTVNPTQVPTRVPTVVPTQQPTFTPTFVPTTNPTFMPTFVPTILPTVVPTKSPTFMPTVVPTGNPTFTPTYIPTVLPTFVPTTGPSVMPTDIPTTVPTQTPSQNPTFIPTRVPSRPPSVVPTCIPTKIPTQSPTYSSSTVNEEDIDENYMSVVVNYGDVSKDIFTNHTEKFRSGMANTINVSQDQVLLGSLQVHGASTRRRLAPSLHITWHIVADSEKMEEISSTLESNYFPVLLQQMTQDATGFNFGEVFSHSVISGTITMAIDFENITLSEWYFNKDNILKDFTASVGASEDETIWQIINITMHNETEVYCNVNAFLQVNSINGYNFYAVVDTVQDSSWESKFIANLTQYFPTNSDQSTISIGDTEAAKHVPGLLQDNDAYGSIFIDLHLKNISKMLWDANIMVILAVLADNTLSDIEKTLWFDLKIVLIPDIAHVNVEGIAQIVVDDYLKYNSISSIIQNPDWQDRFESDVENLFYKQDSNTFEIDVDHIESIVQNPEVIFTMTDDNTGARTGMTSSGNNGFDEHEFYSLLIGILIGLCIMCICCYVCCKKSKQRKKKLTENDDIALEENQTDMGVDIIMDEEAIATRTRHRKYYAPGEIDIFEGPSGFSKMI